MSQEQKAPERFREEEPLAVSKPPHQAHAQIVTQDEKPPLVKRKFWLVELWWESREFLKELIKHVFIFGMLIGSLELFHIILNRSGLPPDQKTALDKIHFYMVVIILVVFSVSFIIKVIKFEFRKGQE